MHQVYNYKEIVCISQIDRNLQQPKETLTTPPPKHCKKYNAPYSTQTNSTDGNNPTAKQNTLTRNRPKTTTRINNVQYHECIHTVQRNTRSQHVSSLVVVLNSLFGTRHLFTIWYYSKVEGRLIKSTVEYKSVENCQKTRIILLIPVYFVSRHTATHRPTSL